MDDSNQLVNSASIEALLLKRQSVIEKMTKALELREEIDKILYNEALEKYEVEKSQKNVGSHEYTFLSVSNICFDTIDSERGFDLRRTQKREISECIKGLDSFYWDYLMEASGLKKGMPASVIEKWDRDIYNKKTPEFTIDNIQSTFKQLSDNRGDMLLDGLVAVFRALSWDHKTNSPFKFGKKLILKTYDSSRYDTIRQLDDLIRICRIIDEKRELSLKETMHGSIPGYNGFMHIAGYECEYADFVPHLNGNIHVKFKDLEMVEKLNILLAMRYPNAIPYEK